MLNIEQELERISQKVAISLQEYKASRLKAFQGTSQTERRAVKAD